MCQIAARALGVTLSDVHVADTATDKVANSQPSAASQSTDLYGMATLNACEQIRERLEPIAKAMTSENGPPVMNSSSSLYLTLNHYLTLYL